MTQTTVRIPAPLRKFSDGLDEVSVHGSTVGQALVALGELHAGMRDKILTPSGDLRSFVNIFVGDSNVRGLGGLEATLAEGDVISIIPAVAGGRS